MSFDLMIKNGDLSVLSNGRIEVVMNAEKLSQDVLKILFTPTNTHILHKWYGSPLSSKVVGKVYPQDILEHEISQSVLYAMKNLKTLQDLQNRDGQFVSPQESIVRVQDVKISFDADPRQILISISILTKSGSVVEETFSISR